jgi:murein DD-endopeptidase MepM/ murein hydrolase activator NlpD
VDDLPDLLPGDMDRKHIAGNHIVIQFDGSETYIGLAHLMQGSVKVKPGERVSTGQPIARVGNSGNTSEPHLHIHAKRGGNPKSMLDGAGVPMRFGGGWLIRNSIVRSAGRQVRGADWTVKAERPSA